MTKKIRHNLAQSCPYCTAGPHYYCGHVQAAAPQQEAREPTEISEAIERMAADRYKVVPSHESMFHRWAVVAGSGTQQLYLGSEVECQNMARKFAGAFLDGAFVTMQSTSPNPAPDAPFRIFLVTQHHSKDGKLQPRCGSSLFKVLSAHGTFDTAERAREDAENAYHALYPGYKQDGVQPFYSWVVQEMEVVPTSAARAPADSQPVPQGEMNVQLDIDSNHSAPGQQRDVARSVALGQPMGNGQDQAAGRPSAQGDKLLTVAERNIRSFLRSAQFKCESDREAALNCVDVLWAAARDPADSVPAVERKQERIAFKDAHRHLDLDEVPDAWGRPMFKHSHVEASWLGWIARASRGKAPAVESVPVLPDFDTVDQHIYGACRRYITQDMLEPIHNLIRDAIDADRTARASAESAERDAERYRWLRAPRLAAGQGSITVELDDRANGDFSRSIFLADLDSAIDAALAAQGGKA